MDQADGQLIVRVEGRVGRITLNRPQALHALSLAMCRAMGAALLAWLEDPRVALVLIDHAGPRGFCAGGDVRRVAQLAAAGEAEEIRALFLAEYRMNELMMRFPKPIVALMDGVTMGGGIGISRPARYRVSTERTLFAMPETAIGFFPDVGAGWFLSRLPDSLGVWLALTGARVGPADGELLGLATDHVSSRDVEALTAALIAEPEAAERTLAEFAADADSPPLATHQDEIARIFSLESVEAIVEALEATRSAWAAEQLAILNQRSPQALKVAWRLLREGRTRRSFAEEMAVEYRLAIRTTARPDFQEGIRAVLVDKDQAPHWRPSTLAQIDDALLDELFAPLPSGEEWSPAEFEG